MAYRRFFIWVEGDDDERFFKNIIKPILDTKYDLVEIRSYASMQKRKFNNYIGSLRAIGADYIYITDINWHPCITAKKEKIKNEFAYIEEDKIIVIIKEIESWYVAGLSLESLRILKIRPIKEMGYITKEKFDTLIPQKFDSRIDFMSEMLKRYSIEIAKNNNRSFKYFFKNYLC